jgi:phosphotriesterase-related protein
MARLDSVGADWVQTYRGGLEPQQLGVTLIHEHIFVRNPELERNIPSPDWDERAMVDLAVEGLERLRTLGVDTVVDLTVPGLGRDVDLVARVAERSTVNLLASTGWYTPNVLPPFFQFNGPGLLIDGPDPLEALFIGDIEQGIGGTGVRAAMLKVMTDAEGVTSDVARVMSAAATAHQQTGVPITTHSVPASRNGLIQQAFFSKRGVAPERLIIGHSGDTQDLDYLCELMQNGSSIGMDRFGMEHVLPDAQRADMVVALLERGYGDRMVLSHDAAFFSHVTPPAWRARHAPNWHMEDIHRRVIPMLTERGVSQAELDQMLIKNPKRLLTPAPHGVAASSEGEREV